MLCNIIKSLKFCCVCLIEVCCYVGLLVFLQYVGLSVWIVGAAICQLCCLDITGSSGVGVWLTKI